MSVRQVPYAYWGLTQQVGPWRSTPVDDAHMQVYHRRDTYTTSPYVSSFLPPLPGPSHYTARSIIQNNPTIVIDPATQSMAQQQTLLQRAYQNDQLQRLLIIQPRQMNLYIGGNFTRSPNGFSRIQSGATNPIVKTTNSVPIPPLPGSFSVDQSVGLPAVPEYQIVSPYEPAAPPPSPEPEEDLKRRPKKDESPEPEKRKREEEDDRPKKSKEKKRPPPINTTNLPPKMPPRIDTTNLPAKRPPRIDTTNLPPSKQGPVRAPGVRNEAKSGPKKQDSLP